MILFFSTFYIVFSGLVIYDYLQKEDPVSKPLDIFSRMAFSLILGWLSLPGLIGKNLK